LSGHAHKPPVPLAHVQCLQALLVLAVRCIRPVPSLEAQVVPAAHLAVPDSPQAGLAQALAHHVQASELVQEHLVALLE